MALLEAKHLTKQFGGLTAVNDVSFKVEPNKITGLIGPNGAGKTTTFNLVTGFLPLTSGTVFYDGADITGVPATKLVFRHMTRTFQIPHLFNDLTVLENVMAGFYSQTKTGTVSAMLRLPSVKKEERYAREKGMEILRDLGMENLAYVQASVLSTGQQKMLEIARALATNPKLLMLDEPASGLNTAETDVLGKMIKRFNQSGITVLMIEHNMKFMMELADYIYVLNFGQLLAEGTPAEIMDNDEVTKAYLGKEFRKDA